MKNYTVLKLSSWWSTDQLRKEVESLLNKKVKQGYEIVSVCFVDTNGGLAQCFITICKL